MNISQLEYFPKATRSAEKAAEMYNWWGLDGLEQWRLVFWNITSVSECLADIALERCGSFVGLRISVSSFHPLDKDYALNGCSNWDLKCHNCVDFSLSARIAGGQLLVDLSTHSLCLSCLIPFTPNLILRRSCKSNCKHFFRYSLVVQVRSTLCCYCPHSSPSSLALNQRRNTQFSERVSDPVYAPARGFWNLDFWNVFVAYTIAQVPPLMINSAGNMGKRHQRLAERQQHIWWNRQIAQCHLTFLMPTGIFGLNRRSFQRQTEIIFRACIIWDLR